jgi:CRISPR-associated protein Csx10
MSRIRLCVEAVSPLAFGARRGTTSNFVDTLDYIPGTTIRGAVASRYLSEIGPASDARFKETFIAGGLLFPNLYPARSNPSLPLPLTARTCKAHPGFLTDAAGSSTDLVHGVGDALIRSAAFKVSRVYRLLSERAGCAICGRPADRFSGVYEKLDSDPSRYGRVEVQKRHLTHVGINRSRQAAEAGFLFAQQVINEAYRSARDQEFQAQLFSGDLIGHDAYEEFVLKELLPTKTVLRLGESRTRGLGMVRVVGCEVVETQSPAAISQQTKMLNEKLSVLHSSLSGRSFFSVTLLSDAILTDAFLRPKPLLDADDLGGAIPPAEGLGSVAEGLEPVYASTATRLVQSWNIASGYPKPDDLALIKGSVFLFEAADGLSPELLAFLALLQERGVGRRRTEGFGRLSVSDSFHLEVDELWQVK